MTLFIKHTNTFNIFRDHEQWLTKVHFFLNVLRVLYETFWDFIGTVTIASYRDYVSGIFNDSENVYTIEVTRTSMDINQRTGTRCYQNNATWMQFSGLTWLFNSVMYSNFAVISEIMMWNWNMYSLNKRLETACIHSHLFIVYYFCYVGSQ